MKINQITKEKLSIKRYPPKVLSACKTHKGNEPIEKKHIKREKNHIKREKKEKSSQHTIFTKIKWISASILLLIACFLIPDIYFNTQHQAL